MRTVLLSALIACSLACSSEPPCSTGASNVRVTDPNGATIFQADSVCAGWNSGYLSLEFEVQHGEEKLYGVSLGSRVNPQSIGGFSCDESELGVTLEAGIDSDKRYDYADTNYKAGYDPGSQIVGTSCTFEVSSAPSSGTMAGSFTGRLGRVPNFGTEEFVDLSFTFSVPGDEAGAE